MATPRRTRSSTNKAARKSPSKASAKAKPKTKAKPLSGSSGPEVSVPSQSTLSRQQRAEQQRLQAEDDLRTLRRAEEIRSQPSRLKVVQKIATEEMQALEKIKKRI